MIQMAISQDIRSTSGPYPSSSINTQVFAFIYDGEFNEITNKRFALHRRQHQRLLSPLLRHSHDSQAWQSRYQQNALIEKATGSLLLYFLTRKSRRGWFSCGTLLVPHLFVGLAGFTTNQLIISIPNVTIFQELGPGPGVRIEAGKVIWHFQAFTVSTVVFLR